MTLDFKLNLPFPEKIVQPSESFCNGYGINMGKNIRVDVVRPTSDEVYLRLAIPSFNRDECVVQYHYFPEKEYNPMFRTKLPYISDNKVLRIALAHKKSGKLLELNNQPQFIYLGFTDVDKMGNPLIMFLSGKFNLNKITLD